MVRFFDDELDGDRVGQSSLSQLEWRRVKMSSIVDVLDVFRDSFDNQNRKARGRFAERTSQVRIVRLAQEMVNIESQPELQMKFFQSGGGCDRLMDMFERNLCVCARKA